MLYSIEEPKVIIEKLREYYDEQQCKVEESEVKYRLKAIFPASNNVALLTKIKKVDEYVNCIKVEKIAGSKMDFLDIFNEIREFLEEVEMIL